MKKIGFIISKKENEYRRAITLADASKIVNKDYVYFEKGYGEVFNIQDQEFIDCGFNMLSRDEILRECDIICDPKIGDAEYLDKLNKQTIFGWVHATQNYDITQKIINHQLTAYAWEKMYEKNRHIFYRNNEIAGEASILHAMLSYGKNFFGMNVAVIGNGNIAKGAIRILNQIGANVTIYTRNKESLFRKEFKDYDVIVNCIMWDVNRKDHILYKSDLLDMKKNALIIDISCDKNGGIETSVPTTIDHPIYQMDGIYHYVVDHSPSLLFYDATVSISNEVVKYVDKLITSQKDAILEDSLIIENGIVRDEEINKFQNRSI